MTAKDGFALAMLILGIASGAFNYAIYWRGRKDIYEGDFRRAKTAWLWATVVFQAFLACAACWIICIIDGVA